MGTDLKFLWSKQDTVTRAVCVFLSVLFSFCYLAGSLVDQSTGAFWDLTPFFPVSVLLLALLSYLISIGLYGLIRHMEILLCQKEPIVPGRKTGLGLFLFLFICWLPYFLVYYPGCMTYDSYYVAGQAVLGVEPSDWHPYTYVLLVRLMMRFGMLFGDISEGVAAYSLFQMAFLAGAVAYGVCWLLKKQMRPYFALLIALFFALVPIFPVLSVTLWKDIPFSICVFLYTLSVYDALESRGKTLHSVPGALGWILLSLLVVLLRHNGYCIVLPTALALFLYLRKGAKRLLPALLLPLLLAPVIQNLYYANGVAKGVFSESLSIPAQQIARTVVSGGTITKEQRESLARFFDMEKLQNYDPFLADPVKNSFNREYLESHKTEFFKLWARLLPPNRKEYCKAYLAQTLGYWMPGVRCKIAFPLADEGEKIGVNQRNLLESYTGEIWNRWENRYRFPSLGTLVWTAVFFAGLTLIKRRAGELIAFLPLFLLWLTLMAATPVHCEFRYLFALPLSLPFLACLSMRRRQ